MATPTNIPMTNTYSLEARRFGRWLVQPLFESRRGGRYWLCYCDCGEERYVRAAALTSGESMSCGCGRPGRWGQRVNLKTPTKTPMATVQYRFWSVSMRRWRAWMYFGRVTVAKAERLVKGNTAEIEYRIRPHAKAGRRPPA